jgi:hypothetical protein
LQALNDQKSGNKKKRRTNKVIHALKIRSLSNAEFHYQIPAYEQI